MADEFITTAEAAKLTGYNEEYVRRLVREGKVRGQKFGTIWQVERDSLLTYYEVSQQSDDGRWGPKPKE